MTKDGGHFYNRMYWAEPDAICVTTTSAHLFRMAQRGSDGTRRARTPLTHRVARFPYLPARLLRPAIPGVQPPAAAARVRRADLRRQLAGAASPSAWRALLKARAIENLSYVIGVNRVGTDGKDLPYAGDSVVHDFLGEPLAQSSAPKPAVVTVELDPRRRCARFANDFLPTSMRIGLRWRA